MGWFESFRVDGGPTLYGPLRSAVTSDVLEMGLFYAAACLAISFLAILLGLRGYDRVFAAVRIVFALFVTTSILVCNYGQEWEVAHLTTRTQYRAGLRHDIHAEVGVKIGLRSVNITLKGDPVIQTFDQGRVNETINYNERFHWNNEGWTQGRNGFGPYAGLFNREYRAAQYRGLPYPILWIAEYFTIDGEGIRWGRNYRQAGFFAHAIIWFAFCCWILSIVLMMMIYSYGAYMMMLTGGCLLLSNVVYACIRNVTQIAIPFEDGSLHFEWGWCFWLCIVTGVVCVVVGFVIFLLDWLASDNLATFFGDDIANQFEEAYYDPVELEGESSAAVRKSVKKSMKMSTGGATLDARLRMPKMRRSGDAASKLSGEASDNTDDEASGKTDGESPGNEQDGPDEAVRIYRRRGFGASHLLSHVDYFRKRSATVVGRSNFAFVDEANTVL